MNYKRLVSLAILLLLLVFPSFASMVTFLVVETGLDEGAANTQHSSIWEGALMSVFFDAGHIVTNHPIARMEKKPDKDLSGSIMIGFIEAIEGGSEYFILGFLEYVNNGEMMIPIGIIIKLYRTDSEELIFEQNFPAGNSRSLGEEIQMAQNVARILVSNIRDN